MWNFDHCLFKPCSPNPSNDPLNDSFTTNQIPSSRHSFISQISFADEAIETNLTPIEINHRTNIDLLISNSWPKSSRNMCGEKRVIKELETKRPTHPFPNAPSNIFVPEFYIGNLNHTTTSKSDISEPNNAQNVIQNETGLGRSPAESDPGMFSTSFVHYIDWGPSEFIDDF